MLVVMELGWVSVGLAGVLVLFAAGYEEVWPLAPAAAALVSGVLMLAIDRGLTRLTEIRDALRSASHLVEDPEADDEDDEDDLPAPHTVEELDFAIAQLTKEQGN